MNDDTATQTICVPTIGGAPSLIDGEFPLTEADFAVIHDRLERNKAGIGSRGRRRPSEQRRVTSRTCQMILRTWTRKASCVLC